MRGWWLPLAWAGLGLAYRLSVPQVLLPQRRDAVLVNFTLDVSDPLGGCFRFTSARPSAVSVTPVGGEAGECGSSVLISALSDGPARTIVTAEEVGGSAVLRCDVLVDAVASVEVLTTTRQLFLEDAPQEFSVLARNDKGDVFTELGPTEFHWDIVGGGDKAVLRLVPWLHSEYETPPDMAALEEAGKQGSVVLMEGQATGTANLTLRLARSSVPPASVALLVVANFLLSPGDVLIPLFARVPFDLLLVKQSRVEIVPMPCPEYHLRLEGPEAVAAFEPATSTVTGLAEGETELRLVDENMAGGVEELDVPPVLARVEVSPAASLHFAVSPGREWVLETGRRYSVAVRLEDRHGRHLHVTANMRLTVRLDQTHFQLHSRSENGSHLELTPIKTGTTLLEGAYVAVLDSAGREIAVSPPIEGHQKVEIFSPLAVRPPLLALAWEDGLDCPPTKFTASGGSGKYLWAMDGRKVARIAEATGAVTPLGPGDAQATLRDARNRFHSATGQVFVGPPTRMVFAKGVREAEVGQGPLELSVRMFGRREDGSEVEMSHCHCLRLHARLSAPSAFRPLDTAMPAKDGIGCRLFSLQPLAAGETKLSLTYQGGSKPLTAETTIAAFEPLQISTPHQPEPPLLLALGSSWQIAGTGGPIAWSTAPGAHYSRLALAKEQATKAFVTELGGSNFRLLCASTAEASVRLVLSVGNKPTSENPVPLERQAELTVCCVRPQRFFLSLVDKAAQDPPCPLPADAPRPVASGQARLPLLLAAEGLCPGDDPAEPRRLANFSSLHLQWSSTKPQLLAPPKDGLNAGSLSEAPSDGLRYDASAATTAKLGRLRLDIAASKFQTQPKASQQSLGGTVEGSLELEVVDAPKLSPASLALFNHPDNKHSLQLSGGSGHFRLLPMTKKSSGTAGLVLKARSLAVSPKQKGELEAVVEDLCLPGRPEAKAEIAVSDIRRLEVSGPELVEEGSEIRLRVGVVDDAGRRLTAKLLPLLNIKPSDDGHGFLSAKEERSESPDSLVFSVRGLKAGVVAFSVAGKRADGSSIASLPHTIEIFAPLRVEPSELLLVPGSVYQLSTSGGPTTKSLPVHWASNSSRHGSLGPAGLLRAHQLGFFAAKAHILQPGSQDVLSQDSAVVEVVHLTGVRVRTGVAELESGCEMPAVAVGLASRGRELSPDTFAAAATRLSFHWELDNGGDPGNKLHPVFHLIEDASSGLEFARRFKAGPKALHAEISLKVTAHGGDIFAEGARDKAASTQVKVIPALDVLSPELGPDSPILVTPETSLQLRLNRPSAQLSFVSEAPDLFRVSKVGQLSSSAKLGLGALRVGTADGGQERLVSVEVARVAYAMLSSDLRLAQPLPSLPVGFNWPLKLSLHDSRGRRFAATDRNLRFRLHRDEFAHVSGADENLSLAAHLKAVGGSILKVWDSVDPGDVWDAVALPSGPVIEVPRSALLTQAALLCPRTQLVDPVWSQSGGLESLAPGVFLVRKAGQAEVVASIGGVQSTALDLAVSPAVRLEFSRANVSFLSNVEGGGGLSQAAAFLLLFHSANTSRGNVHGCSEDQLGGLSLDRTAGELLACSLEWEASAVGVPVAHAFHARPAFLGSSFGCLVAALPFPDSTRAHLSRVTSRLRLTASLKGSEAQGSTTLPFHPSFHVADEVLLLDDREQVQGSVRIHASAEVAASLAVAEEPAWKLLSVGTLSRTAEEGVWELAVGLNLRSKALWVGPENGAELRLTSGLTGQTEALPVRIRLAGQRPSLGELYRSGGLWGVLGAVYEEYWAGGLVLVSVAATLGALWLGWRCLVSLESEAQTSSAALRSSALASRPAGSASTPPTSPYAAFLARGPAWGGGDGHNSTGEHNSTGGHNSSGYSGVSRQGSPFIWSRDRQRDLPTPPSQQNHFAPNLWSSPR